MNFKFSAFTFLLLVVNENGALGRQIRVSGNRNVDRRMQLVVKIRNKIAHSFRISFSIEKANISRASVAT